MLRAMESLFYYHILFLSVVHKLRRLRVFCRSEFVVLYIRRSLELLARYLLYRAGRAGSGRVGSRV